MEKKVRTERKASDYTNLTQHESILKRPNIYIGSMDKYIREEYLIDLNTEKIITKLIDIPDSLIRLYLEILANAGDNVEASKHMGVDTGIIEVTMTKDRITIKSGGEPILIGIDEKLSTKDTCVTVVDVIFGVLNSSSNYDDTISRTVIGVNGIGSKSCNVFSKEFSVKVGDPKRGLEYEGKWENNMYDKTLSKTTPQLIYDTDSEKWLAPIIYNETSKKWEKSTLYNTKMKKLKLDSSVYTGESYVEVSWVLDFDRFGYEEYPEDCFGLFAKYLADYSLTCKIPVYFNGILFDIRSIKEYAKLLFTEDQVDTSVVHFEWETKMPEEFKKLKDINAIEKAVSSATKLNLIPIIEMCILDTPDEGRCFSFVNGLITKDGGCHVNDTLNQISKDCIEIWNSLNTTSPKKNNKKKDEKDKSLVTVKDIKPHLSLVLTCRLVNPTFTSQSKTELKGPRFKIEFNKKDLINIEDWQLIYRINQELNSKQQRLDDKTFNKGKGRLKILKGEEANRAGTDESNKCILFLTEGDSAESYSKRRISKLPGGKDYGGYYPLKGKVLNITNAKLEQFDKNTEIKALIQLIGLIEGLDYTIPENRETPRYHLILSNVDADSDGKHINLLLMNFFNEKFPFILQYGMFGYLLTPAVRVFDNKGKLIRRFYSPEDFTKWNNENNLPNLKVKYYKGLASSKPEDIDDDILTAPTIICFYDSKANASLELAFDKSKADERKEWIKSWRDKTRVDDIVMVDIQKMIGKRNITDIINTDLIDYSIDVFFRAIPNYKDGLKKSQRQALYYILNKWKYGTSNADTTEVSRIAGSASTDLHYHHGEKSLEDTIKKMGQSFIGSNNLNLFYQDGEFGTRHKQGKDAGAGRYIKTKPEWWIKYVYQKELVDLVECNYVEADKVEPIWIPCDIPIHIINGCLGIATGYSTFIPCHNPFDIIKWILNRCKNNIKIPKITPWYNNFTGKLEIKNIKKDEDVTGENIEEEDDDNGEKIEKIEKGMSLRTYGKFEILTSYSDDTYDILITELPVGRATHDYHNWLKMNIGNKFKKEDIENPNLNLITLKSFDDKSDPDGNIWFKLYKFKTSSNLINFKTLKLIKSFGLTNMNLIDDKGFPLGFENINDILELYYNNMIAIYNKLIANRIKTMENNIDEYKIQLKFIELCLDKKIIYENRKKNDIYTQMKKYNIPNEYLGKIKIYDLSYEEVESFKLKIIEAEKELLEIRNQNAELLWSNRLMIFEKELKKRNYGK